MTIKEIRAAREKAEQEIMGVMEKFKSDTGLSIIACDVEAGLRRYVNRNSETYVSRISLTVESI